MNNHYYSMPGVSATQYVAPYVAPDPLERELISSYDEAVERGKSATQKLSLNELRALNENPERIATFVKDTFLTRPMVKTMINQRETIKIQADENLEFRPQLDEAKQNVKQKYDELQELQNSYQDANKLYLQLCEKYNPTNIAQGLLDSVVKIDEKSEQIAESFLQGEKDLDTFLDEYIRHRTLSHSHKTKYEKLTHQLEKLHKANFQQS